MTSAPMQQNPATIDPAVATQLVRQRLGGSLRVTGLRKLHGGMIHCVSEWLTDGTPTTLVAKTNTLDHAAAFERELATLRFYRHHTDLPVPEPYGCVTDQELGLSGLLMETVPGRTLAEARISSKGAAQLQHDLAQHVAKLHDHHSDRFGSALGPPHHSRWLDAFAPGFEKQFAQARDQLASRSRSVIESLLQHLDDWLPAAAPPTLVHGDLWATNILVDDTHPDRPRTLAFIDCDANYCDPEYELAYLRLFHTADDTFFAAYAQHHPPRDGFERRCRVYWLNTMLLHVNLFGGRYLPACEDLVRQIRRLA